MEVAHEAVGVEPSQRAVKFGRRSYGSAVRLEQGTLADNPINAMAVARFSPQDPSGTLEWTLASYNDFPNGKPILDGPGGTAIGQVVELNQVTGGTPFGPSLSAPCIDSVR